MKLISSKKKLKGNSSLTYALYACLASASCEGMEEKKAGLDSYDWSYFMRESNDDSDDSRGSVDYIVDGSNDKLPNSGLYQLSQSEIFPLEEWADIINGSKPMPKSNRRVPVGFFDEKEFEKGALRAPVKRNAPSDERKKEKKAKKKGL